jgi:hypothetical protein
MNMFLRIGSGVDLAGSVCSLISGYCEHSNGPSGSLKDKEFMDLPCD